MDLVRILSYIRNRCQSVELMILHFLMIILIRFCSFKLKVFHSLVVILIRFRSILLIIFKLLMNTFVIHLRRLYHMVKYFGRYIQTFFDIRSESYYSLVSVFDGDFSVGSIADDIFKEVKDWNNPHIGDLFHIYLSKMLYERCDRIIDQCVDWGFERESIEMLTYIKSEDLNKYPYSTKAAVIKHDQSKTIIIAFRETNPLDLLQWLADSSTNFVVIDQVFNDANNDNDPIRVHAGFYFALGLNQLDLSKSIDSKTVTSICPMFLRLLKSIEAFHRKHQRIHISITGYSLGGGLASLFSFVLLAYGWESSICGVYTYGQPLVGNRRYAEILNEKLANRIHRWVNHSDIVTRIPVIELTSIPTYFDRTPFSDAFELATNTARKTSDQYHRHYYHAGLRFKIDRNGHLAGDNSIDEGPILAYQDEFHLFNIGYLIENAISSFFHVSPLRSILWLITPMIINDHFSGDYARKIKTIVERSNQPL